MHYRQYSIGQVLYSEHYNFPRLHYNLYICLLCTVVCMNNVHTAHIFIVCNSVICTKPFNILSILYNGHNALNYTGNFVYSPLNSYCIYIGYKTLNIFYHYYYL